MRRGDLRGPPTRRSSAGRLITLELRRRAPQSFVEVPVPVPVPVPRPFRGALLEGLIPAAGWELTYNAKLL